MKKLAAAIVLTILCITVYAQQTEQRTVSSFSGIQASAGVDVYLKKGDKENVKVEISSGSISDVITEVGGTSLKIGMRSGSRQSRGVKVYVTYVKLEKLEASSGSNIFSEGVIKCNDMIIHATSGATIEAVLEAKSVIAEAKSAGEVELKGTTRSLEAEADSGGVLDAYDLQAESVHAEASSAGSMKVSVSENFRANASSAGSIRYRGNPSKSVTNSSSAGSVKKTN
jgi:hypothetical protein